MPDQIDAIFDQIRDQVVMPVFQRASADYADQLRDMVDVPVVVTTGPRGGKKVIQRSSPGEPPRKETGAYQASLDSFTGLDGEQAQFIIFTPSEIGAYLELGTSRGLAPREHWQRLLHYAEADLPGRVQAAINAF